MPPEPTGAPPPCGGPPPVPSDAPQRAPEDSEAPRRFRELDDDERREHPRFEVTAYVDYTGSEILLYHHIENLSLGGICIRTTMLESLGSKVDLVINFPDLDKTVSVIGEVVWVNEHEPMDMGLRFLDLDEERLAVLREYITKERNRRPFAPSIAR
ncbi:MAG: hypothetical protein CSA65_03220 [Proteobacteria bacterium]|nr:MAG: hypothetical protein CSA65_03220 [Pseudomonadota bacterium]